MPKIYTVRKARKPIPSAGVAVGDTYYYWFSRTTVGQRFISHRHVSKTYPKPSQLTRSEFYRALLQTEESLTPPDNLVDLDTFADELESAADEMDTLADEQEEKRSNMPDALQDSETGTLLETRADSCRELAEALRTAASSVRDLYTELDGDGPALEQVTALAATLAKTAYTEAAAQVNQVVAALDAQANVQGESDKLAAAAQLAPLAELLEQQGSAAAAQVRQLAETLRLEGAELDQRDIASEVESIMGDVDWSID